MSTRTALTWVSCRRGLNAVVDDSCTAICGDRVHDFDNNKNSLGVSI